MCYCNAKLYILTLWSGFTDFFFKKFEFCLKFQIHFSFVYNLCIVSDAKIGYTRCENKVPLYLTRLHYLCIVNDAKIVQPNYKTSVLFNV